MNQEKLLYQYIGTDCISIETQNRLYLAILDFNSFSNRHWKERIRFPEQHKEYYK